MFAGTLLNAPSGSAVAHSTGSGTTTGRAKSVTTASPTAPKNNPTPTPIHPKLFMTTPSRMANTIQEAHLSPNLNSLKTSYLEAPQIDPIVPPSAHRVPTDTRPGAVEAQPQKDRGRNRIERQVEESRWKEKLERETGIEPATNGLGSRYSTIELLPLGVWIVAIVAFGDLEWRGTHSIRG